jgi:protein involved in polysaccharide export with SLBB domain
MFHLCACLLALPCAGSFAASPLVQNISLAGSPAPNAAETPPALPLSAGLLDDKIILKPGESFTYAVWEDAAAPVTLYVDGSGNVAFPLIGKQKAAGLTARALAGNVKAQLEKEYYYKATVIIERPEPPGVAAKMQTLPRVTVSGQVMNPGVYNIPDPGFTVSQIVLCAGGLAKYANASKVRLIRQNSDGKTATTLVDLKKILEEGRRDLDPAVQPGDTLNVPERLINF